VITLFTKDEIDIASTIGMDMIFPGRKPLKSSKDRIDLLFMVQLHIFLGMDRLSSWCDCIAYLEGEKTNMISLVLLHNLQ
jgi:hypothetical protein